MYKGIEDVWFKYLLSRLKVTGNFVAKKMTLVFLVLSADVTFSL